MNNLKLAVEVVRAHNLLPKDGQGSSSAAVELVFDGQKFRTTIKERDLNPFWNETFYFNVANPLDLRHLTLEAHLYSINRATSKKHSLGKVRINGTSFVPLSDSVVFNYPLEKNSLFSSTRGELALKVYLTGDPTPSHHYASSSSFSSLHSIHDEPSPRSHRHEEKASRSRRSLYTLAGSDHSQHHQPQQQQQQHQPPQQQQQQQSQQQRPSSSYTMPSYQTTQYNTSEMMFEPQSSQSARMHLNTSSQPNDFSLRETNPVLGGGRIRATSTYDLVQPMQFLFVRVVKARDLPSKDATGSLDPYVVVKLGNYKGVTRHFDKTKNPEWNTVFTFSKDRMQATILEVVVMDKDVIKDDFVGVVKFDLHDIPRRAPPDSPLAPEWHRLEDSKGERKHGELMVAVWIGTQADEAFADAWHSDAASLVDTSASTAHIRSKVYHAPRLWYVRVNVIEAQDLVTHDRNRYPVVHVKAQIGNQILRTKPVQSQTSNASWNEDLMFVAAEPFDDDQLVISVDDRVGPNKEESLGKAFVPLATIEKRADDRVVHTKWWHLQKPSATEAVELKRDHFASRIHLRICLDGGYHVLDESTQYSSDLRPTAKQLWKPPVGVLELGILNANALTPMKSRNGRGTSDTFCVAKYGQKWIRTRTITDSLNPKFNEQYTWDVYDPATVLTVGVFDNGHFGGANSHRDLKIGKVRIRISTLETNRVYTHSYPLVVLHPSGVKKMGELHLAIRFTCTSMLNMMSLYSRPLLPKMHYVRPLSVAQLDMLRYQAVNILAARLSRAEPPLRKEVVEYMSDVNSHLWSMRRSKANFYRLMAVFNGIFAVSKWLNEVCHWKNPVTTVLVYALFVMLVFFPDLILPTLYLYMFLIGLWNYRFRPKNPPHMNMRLSCADTATADELDEEFDTFPTARSGDTLRMRYDRLRSVAGQIQRVVGDVASQGERVQAVLSWRDPRATIIFMAFCIASAVVFYAVPLQLLIITAGSYAMRPPKFRRKLPPAPLNFFRRLPARTDSML
ncbi:FT-interacting protein 3-like [Salvia hispanica]|uniref:FT-interacting protein 3-like n=1 Tax=Salvia hispanica TaxID=49212 RepID=UPI0020094B8A|nr:FT-interacting protein 3-like [Salvia hispanica]